MFVIGQFGPETANLAINKGCYEPIIFEHFVIDTIHEKKQKQPWNKSLPLAELPLSTAWKEAVYITETAKTNPEREVRRLIGMLLVMADLSPLPHWLQISGHES